MRREVSETNQNPGALVPVSGAALAIEKHPGIAYLASLGSGSRRTMRESLASIARLLREDLATADDQTAILSIEWHALTVAHAKAIRTKLAESYAPNTANKKLAALRGVLKNAWELGQLTRDEYERLANLPPVKGERLKRGRDISAGEIRALFESCQREDSTVGARDAAMVALLFGAGLRRSEVAGLTFGDWDAAAGEVRIIGKGNKERAVPLPDGTRRALNAWLLLRGPGAAGDPLLCPVNKGGKVQVRAMTTQAVWKALNARALKAGVSKLSPHDFRRTYIGDLLDAGADLSTAQQLAGHSDPKTTAGYDRRPDTAKRRAANLLHVPFVG